MTTAYRSDLIGSLYETEIAKLTANPSVRMEACVVSCPKKDCCVQYNLLGPTDTTEGEIVRHKAAVAKAMQQQFCPHHPPKIELD
jgi:hypothetical protein